MQKPEEEDHHLFSIGRAERWGERMMQDRRAAPLSKVFTIPAKNKVQKGPKVQERRSFFPKRNWQQKAESPLRGIPQPSMGVKAFPVEGEGPSLETKRCSRGRFLVLLVAIYGLRRLNVGQRHFQEPSLLLSSARTSAPITGVYFGSFFARKGPAFCIGHDPHRQPPFGSLSLFFIDRTDRCMNVCICVRKVLATFHFEN